MLITTSQALAFASRAPAGVARADGPPIGGSVTFWAAKRGFDFVASLLALPMLGLIALVLMCLNPIWKPGPLLYSQQRMGRGGKPITVTKFRTMLLADGIERGPADPLEIDGITPLGDWLRPRRIDDLPQLVLALRGELCRIAPRPDYFVHAEGYLQMVPGYAARHVVRPGISGYAQVTMGYAEGLELAAEKARLDNSYIRNAGWRMEAKLLVRTVRVLASGFGAR